MTGSRGLTALGAALAVLLAACGGGGTGAPIDLNFRRGMIMTDGSVLTLITRPGTAAILAVGVVLVLVPQALRLHGRISGRRELATLGQIDG